MLEKETGNVTNFFPSTTSDYFSVLDLTVFLLTFLQNKKSSHIWIIVGLRTYCRSVQYI